MHERLRLIRKTLKEKTSQEKFGEILGVSRDAIKTYELGKVIPSDTFIQLLCTKFNISEHWLRTGEGSMEAPNQIDSVVELLKSTFDNLDSYDKQVIEAWLKATPEDRAAMKRFIDSLKNLQDKNLVQNPLLGKKVIRLKKISKIL